MDKLKPCIRSRLKVKATANEYLQSQSKTNPKMSARWMMDPEFEIDDYEYYNTDDEEDDENYYANHGENKCIVCMGGNYIRTIYIGYEDEDYDDTNDF